MEHARLPIQLCELIIDCSYHDVDNAWSCTYTPEYATLTACALACSDWVPRARRNLYRHVWLRHPRTPDLLERTLISTPYLGGFVRRLTVGSGAALQHTGSLQYISFARATFLRLFAHVQRLRLNVTFQHYPPQYHCHLLRKFPITEVRLTARDFAKGSLLAGYRLLWSLPKLEVCERWEPHVSSEYDIDRELDVVEALAEKREKHGICKNLSHLILRFYSLTVRGRAWNRACIMNTYTHLP